MLARIALRVCVQEALRDQTLAGGNVLDSQFAAMDLDADGNLRTDQEKPFISVYTDGSRITAFEGLTLFGQGDVDLVIEAGISAAMLEQDPETGVRVVGNGFPDTDSGMEMSLDLIMRQVSDALTRPNHLWADLVREFLGKVKQIERARIGAKNGGVRIAGHELRISAELVQDPVVGGSIAGTTFEKFLAALAASGDVRLVKIGETMLAVLDGAGPAYEAVQRELGLSDGQSTALGMRPLATAEGGAVPDLVGVTVERD